MDINNQKAQSSLAEYVITFFIVITVITGMSLFYSRLVQGRVRDAHKHMWQELRARTAGVYNGPIYMQYEPYYVNTVGEVKQDAYSRTQLLPSAPGSTGIYRKKVDDYTHVSSYSLTAPPKEADKEYEE